MTDFGPKEAAQALNDIQDIVQRVRQSRIYDIASQIMIAAGVLVLAGNVANFLYAIARSSQSAPSAYAGCSAPRP